MIDSNLIDLHADPHLFTLDTNYSHVSGDMEIELSDGWHMTDYGGEPDFIMFTAKYDGIDAVKFTLRFETKPVLSVVVNIEDDLMTVVDGYDYSDVLADYAMERPSYAPRVPSVVELGEVIDEDDALELVYNASDDVDEDSCILAWLLENDDTSAYPKQTQTLDEILDDCERAFSNVGTVTRL